jgi:hypothetical protein
MATNSTNLPGNGNQTSILLNVFDGTRQPISDQVNFLLRVRDGNQNERFSNFVQGPTVRIEVPFFDNFGDRYTVLVSEDNHRDALIANLAFLSAFQQQRCLR